MSNLSIQTNSNNDIFIGQNGNLAMATGVIALQQDCEHAMKAVYGEMFLNPTSGQPYLLDVFLAQNFIKFEAAARATLIGINGVVSVQSFTMKQIGDVFNYTAQILTVYSSTLLAISGALDLPA